MNKLWEKTKKLFIKNLLNQKNAFTSQEFDELSLENIRNEIDKYLHDEGISTENCNIKLKNYNHKKYLYMKKNFIEEEFVKAVENNELPQVEKILKENWESINFASEYIKDNLYTGLNTDEFSTHAYLSTFLKTFSWNKFEMTELLINNGIPLLEERDFSGIRGLMTYALNNKNLKAIDFLIKKCNVDINSPYSDGTTYLSEYIKHPELVELLLKNGANVIDQNNNWQESLIHIKDNLPLLELFVTSAIRQQNVKEEQKNNFFQHIAKVNSKEITMCIESSIKKDFEELYNNVYLTEWVIYEKSKKNILAILLSKNNKENSTKNNWYKPLLQNKNLKEHIIQITNNLESQLKCRIEETIKKIKTSDNRAVSKENCITKNNIDLKPLISKTDYFDMNLCQ